MSTHPERLPVLLGADIGTVRLTVADTGRSRAFYERVIGLGAANLGADTLALGVNGERPLIELHANSSAPTLNRRAPGLFHLAILVPTRRDLALALARLVAFDWPLDGAADHLVSEALYLSDPDGNGIEIYHDRPRALWPRAGTEVQMATLPLDLEDLLRAPAATNQAQRPAAAGTRIGHVHLQVAELGQAEAFYGHVLGFEVTARGHPGAVFLATGGYHHHVGLNTWNSRGASPPPPGSIGLRSYEVQLPGEEELDRVLGRARTADIAIERRQRSALLRDPSGNIVELRIR